jgi:hypothetical protein
MVQPEKGLAWVGPEQGGVSKWGHPDGEEDLPDRQGPTRRDYLGRKMGIPCNATQISPNSKVEPKTVNPVIQFPSTQGLSRAAALCFAPGPHAIRSRARDLQALRAHEDLR